MKQLSVFAITVLTFMTLAQASGQSEYEIAQRTRTDVEAELPAIEAAYRMSPGVVERRRAYAKTLFELGNVWQANDVIAPIATSLTTNVSDLELGAKLALLTHDLERAELLYTRLSNHAQEDSELHDKAIQGLSLTYFQANQLEKIGHLPPVKYEAGDLKLKGRSDFRNFLKKLEGQPYQIEWASADHTGHIPFTNDIFEPGVLPYMEVTINGHTLSFLLDTGGALLYIDKSVFERVGVRTIQDTQNKYAFTNGEYVEEFFGIVDSVKLEGVTVRNVPVQISELRARGVETDGIVTTQFLKQFLSTIDYENNEITLRERSETGKAQFLDSMAGRDLVQMPYFLSSLHLMFAKGSFNGHAGLNMFMDSGLASAQEAIVTNETADLLGLDKKAVTGTRYYTASVDEVGLDGLAGPAGQVLGNVFVEENPYWSRGFAWDGLISHKYLWTTGSWTIDFDTMTYYFPAQANAFIVSKIPEPESNSAREIKVENPEPYVGSYEVAPGIDLVITVEDGVLMLQPPGQGPIGITAFDDGSFGIPLANAIIEFEGDPSSGITALNMIQGSNTTHAVRK